MKRDPEQAIKLAEAIVQCKLQPWQKDLLRALMNGDIDLSQQPRRQGKTIVSDEMKKVIAEMNRVAKEMNGKDPKKSKPRVAPKQEKKHYCQGCGDEVATTDIALCPECLAINND